MTRSNAIQRNARNGEHESRHYTCKNMVLRRQDKPAFVLHLPVKERGHRVSETTAWSLDLGKNRHGLSDLISTCIETSYGYPVQEHKIGRCKYDGLRQPYASYSNGRSIKYKRASDVFPVT